jgi:leader peptidase (prepilin peptidase)/N-methyltransferase
MALISPAGIGMGDVKLALAVGAYAGYFGWNVFALSTLLSFVAAAIVGALLLLFRRVQRGAAVPFGPSMFLGALVAVWLA